MPEGPDFFNMVADPRDFPPYADLPPKELLKKFNDEIKGAWLELTRALDARKYQRKAGACVCGVVEVCRDQLLEN